MELTSVQKRQRLLMMISGAFVIFFTGFPHVWSVYQPYVMKQAGWSQSQASMCFYLSFVAFVLGNIFGGKIQDKYSPKLAVTAGGGLFAAGVLLSGFLITPSPIPIYLTYGLLQGLGQGMAYITVLSTAQKWFPGRTGFASGIIVTANGICGLIMAPVSRALLESGGVKFAFITIGIAITAAWILSSAFLVVPSRELQAQMAMSNGNQANSDLDKKQYTSKEMMSTKAFYFLLMSMMFGLMAYFMVSPVSQTHQLSLGIPASIAVASVMLGSIANAGARLLLPTLSDKVGRSICVKMVLIASMIGMVMLSVSHSYMTSVAVVLMYGCYGGIMGNFPAFTSSIFGIEHAGENYGLVMLGIVVSSFLAPGISSFVLDRGFTMHTVFAVGIVFAVASFISLLMLDKELKKMEENKEPNKMAV